MKNTRRQILDASLLVFSKKGYDSSSTLEISREAGVAEMTLFRHFQTKMNLFVETIQYALGLSMDEEIDTHVNLTLVDLIKKILHQKLTMISKNKNLIKMLIRETLANTLTKDLEFTRVISHQVDKQIMDCIRYRQLSIDSKELTDVVVGILLKYAIIEEGVQFHLLSETNQNQYINRYLKLFNI